MDCSTPGFAVLHQLPEFAQTHVHWIGDVIQPSHPLLSPSPAFNLSQHQGFFSMSQFLPSRGQSIGVLPSFTSRNYCLPVFGDIRFLGSSVTCLLDLGRMSSWWTPPFTWLVDRVVGSLACSGPYLSPSYTVFPAFPVRICYFWTVVLEKTLESPLDCKEIQPVHLKADQSWVFIGRTDDEAETPILWPPHVKSWLIGKDPDAGRDWGQEEKGSTEDEMAGWHHRLDEHEFE